MATSQVSDSNLAALTRWLLSREDDIATSIEDFGELKKVFRELICREAGEDE